MDAVIDGIGKGEVNPLWVTFPGKEPTLFPDELAELARAIRAPMRETVLMTNGLNGDVMLDLAHEDLITCFDVSLDGDVEGHEVMRGLGTYHRTVGSLTRLLATHTNALVGVISTLAREMLPSGRSRAESIATLGRELADRFGSDPRVNHSISLYYGPPGDLKLLDLETIADLCERLRANNTSIRTRVLVTANYAHLWGRLAKRLGIEDVPVQFDASTGLAVVRCGSLDFVLFMMSATEQNIIRVATQGETFLSCNHLEAPREQRIQFSLGNVQQTPLSEIVRLVATHEHPLMKRVEQMASVCSSCPHLQTCGGGDVLSGVYFEGVNRDPYCDLLREVV
jgi:radical SAM protein with 4Fe4S-binding SPASM domain